MPALVQHRRIEEWNLSVGQQVSTIDPRPSPLVVGASACVQERRVLLAPWDNVGASVGSAGRRKQQEAYTNRACGMGPMCPCAPCGAASKPLSALTAPFRALPVRGELLRFAWFETPTRMESAVSARASQLN